MAEGIRVLVEAMMFPKIVFIAIICRLLEVRFETQIVRVLLLGFRSGSYGVFIGLG